MKKRKKRAMPKKHPLAGYFRFVKAENKDFRKADGKLDVRAMWKTWKAITGYQSAGKKKR